MKYPFPSFYIDEIFLLLEKAIKADEVPAVSLTFNDDGIISKHYNLTKTKKSPTAHSEILCIEDTAETMQSERLTGVSMLCSLEPCLMCSGAISQARLKKVYYLCPAESGVGLEDLVGIQNMFGRNKGLNFLPEIIFISEYENKIKNIMKEYFKKKRKN